MQKRLFGILLFVFALFGLTLGTAAAERTVYVADGGTGDGSSAASPLGSLAEAAKALDGGDGRIVLVGDCVQRSALTLPEAGNVTYTSEGGELVLAADLSFEKNTDDGVITLDLPIYMQQRAALLGGFNNLVFGENCTVTGELDFYGGVDAPEGTIRQHALNRTLGMQISCEIPYSITVNGGSFATFAGGNRRPTSQALVGSIAVPVAVTINGGSFGGSVSYDVNSNNKDENAFSLSGMSLLCDDASLTVNGGSFALPIYAQGRLGEVGNYASYNSSYAASDSRLYALDGDISFTLTGGSFSGGEVSAFQTSTGYTQLLRGNFDLNIGAGADFAAGTVLDATQVKAYAGETRTATLVCPDASAFMVKRFDIVNGAAQSYTEPLRIVFVGDSITEGTGANDPTHNAYAARVLEKAEKNGMELVVSNFGVGASTVLDYNSIRHRDTLAGVLSLHEADGAYVLVALGTNDAAIAGGTAGQTAHFEREYDALLRDYGALPDTEKVYTTSAIYRYTSNKPADVRAVSVIRPIQARVTEALAAESPDKYVYVDLYALLLEEATSDRLFASDKLHPDADGYVIYADAVYAAIFEGKTTVDSFYRSDIYLSASGRLDGAGTASNPISSLTVAFGLADPDGETTIHIIGEVTYDKFVTPLGSGKLHFVGEGDNAVLTVSGDTIRCCGDVSFDNLTLKCSATATFLVLGWHNFELTETVDTEGIFYLVCGNLLFEGDMAKTAFDDAASAGSAENQTVTVNGGSYNLLCGGNYRLYGNSPFAVYSGNQTLNIGAGASFAYNTGNGVVGQNYLTGSTTANIASSNIKGTLRDYAQYGKLDGQTYAGGRNTGKVTVNLAEGVSLSRIITGDLNGDGQLDIVDSLLLVRAMFNGLDAAKQPYYHDFEKVGLSDVAASLKRLTK